jgi:hypothetical protein
LTHSRRKPWEPREARLSAECISRQTTLVDGSTNDEGIRLAGEGDGYYVGELGSRRQPRGV